MHEDEFAVFEFTRFFGLYGNDDFRQFDDERAEGEEDDDGDDGEEGVRVGDLSSDVIGREGDDEVEERGDGEDEQRDDDGSEDIEEQVHASRSLSISICRQRRQDIGHDGADSGANRKVNGDGEGDDVFDGEGLENDDGRG